jgi:RHS repeat-associated protein
LGNTVTYGYDQAKNRNRITDRNGHATTFTYDVRGNVLTTTNPNDPANPNDGGVTTIVYGNSTFPDLPTRKTDTLGNVTDWTYDAHGNVLTEKRYTTPGLSEFVQKSWTYNSFGQKLTETDENDHTHQWIYDANGLLTQEIDAAGDHTWYGYDALWRQTSVTNGRGTGAADPAYTTTTVYDKADRVIEVIGPPVGSPAHNIHRGNAYDNIGNRTATTDGRGNTGHFFYDNNSNLIRTEEPLDSNPAGRVTQYGYDELDRKVSMTDANGHVTTFTYDDAGRMLSTIVNPGGLALTTTYTYDAQGNRITETDPSGVTLTYTYDWQNRRTVVRDELNYSRQTAYDKLDRATQQIDANGYPTSFAYDALGQLSSVTDAENGLTQYTYDNVGNLLQITDANAHVVSTRLYDNANRLIRHTDGDGHFYQYAYDAVGNQTTVIDANGQTTTLIYDAENRLVQINYPDSTQVTHAYDDNGNRVGMTDPTGTSSFTYDELNRLRTSTDSTGKQVTYGYDAVGNRTSLTYPGDGVNPARTVTYAYDAASRLASMTDWESRTTNYTYNGLRLATTTFPNGLVETRGYDNAGRLTSMDTTAGSQPLIGLTWQRDGEGNPAQLTEDGTLEPTPSMGVVDYQYDSDNRLMTTTGASYMHDNNGNLTSRTVKGVTTTFTYDPEDRLGSQTTNGSSVQHMYDGLGNRIARTAGGSATRYVLDHGQGMSHVLCETNAAGDVLAYYIYGPLLVGRIAADGTANYYHANDTGNILALSDATGQLTDQYAYGPFGEPAGCAGTTSNPFAFAGALGVMADADGLYFMRARFYDPATGRFLGKDAVQGALTDPQGLHRYVYVKNRCTVAADPAGTEPMDDLKGGLNNTVLSGGGLAITALTGALPLGLMLGGSSYFQAVGQVTNAIRGSSEPADSFFQAYMVGVYFLGGKAREAIGGPRLTGDELSNVRSKVGWAEDRLRFGYAIYGVGDMFGKMRAGSGGYLRYAINGRYASNLEGNTLLSWKMWSMMRSAQHLGIGGSNGLNVPYWAMPSAYQTSLLLKGGKSG